MVKFTTALFGHKLAAFGKVMLAPMIVTVKECVVTLPAASSNACVTVVVPTGNVDPEGKPDVRVTEKEQLSVTV